MTFIRNRKVTTSTGLRTHNLRIYLQFTCTSEVKRLIHYATESSQPSACKRCFHICLPAGTDYSLRGPMDKASPSYFVKRRKARIAGSSPAGGSIGFWFCLNFPTQNIYKIAFSIETCCNTLKLSGSIYSSGRPVINMAHEC